MRMLITADVRFPRINLEGNTLVTGHEYIYSLIKYIILLMSKIEISNIRVKDKKLASFIYTFQTCHLSKIAYIYYIFKLLERGTHHTYVQYSNMFLTGNQSIIATRPHKLKTPQ